MDSSIETVYQNRDALLDSIRKSDVLTRYENAKEALKDHEDLKEQIDRFRLRCYQLSNNREPQDMLGEMQHLFTEREKLYADPLMGEYLASELALCRMLQRICQDVLNVTDLEIEPFEKQIEV